MKLLSRGFDSVSYSMIYSYFKVVLHTKVVPSAVKVIRSSRCIIYNRVSPVLFSSWIGKNIYFDILVQRDDHVKILSIKSDRELVDLR